MRKTLVWSLGWEYPLEEGMETHSSTLAWRIPWTEEPGGLQSTGSERVRHEWAAEHSTALGHSAARMGAVLLSALLSGPPESLGVFPKRVRSVQARMPQKAAVAACLFPRPLCFCPQFPRGLLCRVTAASTPAAVVGTSLAAPLGYPGDCLLSCPLRKSY